MCLQRAPHYSMIGTPDYEEWKSFRKTCSLAFSPDNMRKVIPLVTYMEHARLDWRTQRCVLLIFLAWTTSHAGCQKKGSCQPPCMQAWQLPTVLGMLQHGGRQTCCPSFFLPMCTGISKDISIHPPGVSGCAANLQTWTCGCEQPCNAADCRYCHTHKHQAVQARWAT